MTGWKIFLTRWVWMVVLCFLVGSVRAMEPVLFRTGASEVSIDDFERIYNKDNPGGEQKPEEYLSLYIPYRLKIIAAREAGIDTLSSIADECRMFRDSFADKCIYDTIISVHLLPEAYERSRHEIKASHIMLKIKDSDTLSAYNETMRIRREALTGGDFGELAERCSEDASAKINKGALDYFSVFRMPYPFETAAYRTETGGISMPVRVGEAYHLIKVHDRRICGQEKPMEEVQSDLVRKIKTSDRMAYGTALYVKRLKEKYHFIEDTSLLKEIVRQDQDTNSGNRTLFSFAGKKYELSCFEQTLENTGKRSLAEIEQAYARYADHVLLAYENAQLDRNRDFRTVVNEYCEGLLIFEITDREVWSKSMVDSAGLKSFFDKNAKSFRWKKRMDATVYYCSDKKIATRVNRIVTNKNEVTGRLPYGMFTSFCDAGSANPCIDTLRSVFPKGANTIADRVKWKKGCSKILEWEGKYVFLDIHGILRPERKTFGEAKGEAMAAWQEYLENRWIENLKEKYPVVINETAWLALKKKYE